MRFGGALVLRSVRAVFRDDDWNSCRVDIDEVTTSEFGARIALHCDDRGAALSGTIEIKVDDAELEVRLDVVSHRDFMTNRVGLVVLHPASLSGRRLRVVHPDGTSDETAFPNRIMPHQPALDVAGLAWDGDGHTAELGFSGEVFEMEDQRNWSDASYKSYSRPLALPFPYLLAAGERVRQAVRLRVRPRPVVGPAQGATQRSETIALRAAPAPFPVVGTSVSSAPAAAALFEAARCAAPIAAGAPLLVELDLATPNWRAALARAVAAAAAYRAPLDVRVVLVPGSTAGLDDAARALRGLRTARVGAFWPTGPSRHVSDAEAVAALRGALQRAEVAPAEIIGGARSHFTELNRERSRLPADLDGITFAVTPLFHERGTDQLLESVAMQRLIARQAVTDAAGTPVHVGPITLRPRYNDCAAHPRPAASGASLDEGFGAQFADADDERQRLPQLAAWTVASAAALGVPGVASLSYFEDWGPRGIRGCDGTDFPVAAALRALSALSGESLLSGDSVDGLVWAIGAVTAGRETVLVANLDRRERTIEVTTPAGGRAVTIAAESWRRLGG